MTPPKKQEKQKLPLFQLLIIIAAVGFALWYVVSTLAPSATPYGTVEAGTYGARYSGDALIVRNETPYDAEGVSNITYVAEEGSVVYTSNTICYVYSSGYSTKEMTTLQGYRDEIRDYQQELLESETTTDARMDQLSEDVLARAKEFRAMIAGQRGNLPNQQKLLSTAIEARQTYLKKKYNSDQRLARLYDDEENQQNRINSWTQKYVATGEYIVSFYLDDYEYSLTTNTYNDLLPSEVRAMVNGYKPEKTSTQKSRTTIYRTVRDGSWKVLMLVDDEDWNPTEGAEYELMLEGYESTTVRAKVESFTRSGGELLVRLSVEDSVSPVLYIRSCTAELGDYVQMLRVPSRALYTQNDMTGVVVLDGSNRVFVPVEVSQQDGGYAYITAVQQGLLYEGQTVVLF